MATPLVWLRSSRGLNNKVDPVRVAYDPSVGVTDLTEAVNIVHDYTGAISRRLGYTATDITSECHSLFCEGGECLFVTGNALCVLANDFRYTPIRNVTVGANVSYAQVGEKIYYVNGHEKGFVMNSLSYDWAKAPDPRYPDATRTHIDPPIGTIVRLFNARIYIAQGNVVWHSEPFGYNLFDPARGYFVTPGRVTMIRPVKQGLFVSTESRTYFYRGVVPEEFIVETAALYPVIEGTDAEADGSNILNGELGLGVLGIWTTPQGICIGLPSGEVVNLTLNKLDYPNALRGAGLCTDEKYIFTLEP